VDIARGRRATDDHAPTEMLGAPASDAPRWAPTAAGGRGTRAPARRALTSRRRSAPGYPASTQGPDGRPTDRSSLALAGDVPAGAFATLTS
jgi:hypothetical protein